VLDRAQQGRESAAGVAKRQGNDVLEGPEWSWLPTGRKTPRQLVSVFGSQRERAEDGRQLPNTFGRCEGEIVQAEPVLLLAFRRVGGN
jgi:hypothetical protein